MSWSIKIGLLYSGFVLLILSLVFGASSQDFHLVTENYYAEELAYQEKIDAARRAQSLESPLMTEVDMAEKAILLVFPATQVDVVGEVSFYKPDNAQEDRSIVLNPVAGRQTLSLAGMRHGRWVLQVQWESGGKMYYQEKEIFIP